MSNPYPHLADSVGWGHPSILGQRARTRLLVGLGALIPAILALAISVALPTPSATSMLVVIAITLGAAGVFALMFSARYPVTLTVLVLYLGLLDGPIKDESASKFASGVRDLLIVAIGLGMLIRLLHRRERITLPPLSAWVLAFVAVVAIEALNPNTNGILKIIGGYRQQLEWVPLFFFGYLIIRSKQRFRQLFLLLGVIALANGVVGAYQSRLSPAQLASWGPGYGERVKGTRASGNGHGLTGRTYVAEGEGHPRPLALGSDSGFGGTTGVLALPGLMALLAVGRLRRRWPVVLCCVGALAGIVSSVSRTSTVVAVVALLCFAVLWAVAGLPVRRVLAGVMVVATLLIGVGSVLVAIDGGSILQRQETIISPRVKETAGLEVEEEKGEDAKTKHLSEIPRDFTHAPFGFGLGIAGSAAGFGGVERASIEEEKVSGASAYNLLAVEVGAPGLLLWIGLTLNVMLLAITRLRRVADHELRTYLVAMLAAFVAFTVQGLSGPTLAVMAGAYLWFTPGVLAYWLAGEGWRAMVTGSHATARVTGSSPAHAVAA
jgi:hypothetical protein